MLFNGCTPNAFWIPLLRNLSCRSLATELCLARLLLSASVTNAVVLMRSVSVDCVLDVLDLARAHGCFERLEDRCCEVIETHLEALLEAPLELRSLHAAKSAEIVQGGDVRVADVQYPMQRKSNEPLEQSTGHTHGC